MMVEGALVENQRSNASKKIEQFEIEVSILRDAYFQLEKALLERKKAEEALRESEEKYRRLFESANDIIQSFGPDGVFIDVNPTWCEVLGYSEEEALKMNLMDIIHPRSQEHCGELFKKVIFGEPAKDIEAEFITKKGKVIIVNGNASCIHEGGRPRVTWGIFRDVTERKNIDRMKDEFLDVAAHDLRTPTAAIRGFISRVLDGDAGEVPDKARGLLEYAYEGNKRLIHLVDDFLIVSRLERGKIKIDPKSGNLGKCVETVVNELSGLAKQRGLTFEYKKIMLPQVMIDEERIIQVLTNLVGNAIKFTEGGGVVIAHEIVDEQVITSVTDTGIGISKEAQKHLFEKYFKGEASEVAQSGLGLGLYISKLIVEGHGGKVWARSEEGRGSTFSFSLSVKTFLINFFINYHPPSHRLLISGGGFRLKYF